MGTILPPTPILAEDPMRTAVIFATLLVTFACKPRTDASAVLDDGAVSSANECRTGFETSCTPAQLDQVLANMVGDLDAAVLAVTREDDFVVAGELRLPEGEGYALTDELDINKLRTRVVDLRRDVGALQQGRESASRLGEVLSRIEAVLAKVGDARRQTGPQAPDESGLKTIDLMTKQLQALVQNVRTERARAQAREDEERRVREAELQRIADERARQQREREYQDALRQAQERAAQTRRDCNARCESALTACDRRATTNSDRIVCRTERWECVGRC